MKNLLIRLGAALVGGAIFFGVYFYNVFIFGLLLTVVFLWILVFEWPKLCKRNKRLWLLTPLYPIFPMLLLLAQLVIYKKNILFPLFPFFIAWAADTGGYIFGKLFGRHKICPSISPKKSWEGLLGSLIAVIAVVFLMCGQKLRAPWVFAFALLLTAAALAGDLFESFLKRRAGIKDAGFIMPGHGGLLDRFDSVFGVVIAETFVMAVILRFI